MNYKIRTIIEPEQNAMRDKYAETLTALAAKDPKVISMDCDLMNSIGMVPFSQAFPQQTINCGIQEANMIGVAAGMSAVGMKPFVHTFGVFATRRVFDQVFVSGGFAQADIRIIGSDPGVTAAFNGGTHMPFEDMGIMRTIPGMTIVEPTDSVMLEDILLKTYAQKGMFYIRLSRKNAMGIYEEGSNFEIGKATKLREGSDVTIIATGICVADSLTAAEELKQAGIHARVLNMFTLKPIDREAIIAASQETGAVVTVENHNIINGLGSAVSEVLCECAPAPLVRVGVQDEFGEVGSVDYLKKRFGLTADNIVEAAKQVYQRKIVGGRKQ